MWKVWRSPPVLLVMLLWSFTATNAQLNIHEKMYFDLDQDSFAACVRRFNGTHQFGCSSEIDGNVGVLHVVESMEDIDWLLHNSTRGPYVGLLDISMFNRSYLVPLNSSSNINGIIFTYNQTNAATTKPKFFSQEDSCPNRYTSLNPQTKQLVCDSTTPWNPYGTNIMNENWNFPIVIISDNIIIDSLVQCYKDHNTPLSVQEDSWHPLCGLEMEMGMSGNTNTEVCIRRSRLYYENHAIKQCDALGGRNIVYSAEKLSADQPIKNHSLILVTARLDSKSMFDGIVPGALSTVTSIVTLLSAARILSQARSKLSPPSKPNTNALFLLLDGEAYDYIGSSRVVYDMKTGGFPKTSLPIGEQHVKLMIELSQIASNKYIGLHSTSTDNNVEDLVRQLKINAKGTDLEDQVESFVDSNLVALAPSSLLYFQNSFSNLSGVLLTSSNDTINTNKYYHSIFDDETNVAYTYYNGSSIPTDSIQSTIKSVATVLARSLLNQMHGDDIDTKETIDEHLVDEMLYCYLKSHNCTLFTQLTGHMDNTRPTYYVGIKDYKRYIVTATGILLANLTGTVTNMTKDECKAEMNRIYEPGTSDNQNYYWIVTNITVENAGYCNKNLVNFTAAVSPAFTIDGYNWSSGTYPSWSESVWMKLGLRMFMKPSPSYEKLVFLSGLGVLAVSFLCVLSLKKHITHLVSSIV
ncbi:hypothetical protein M8J75_016366 [Diaphorina citri]|nr:hypothetical protein M8J75_016366 [Diaphorina citri]